MMTESIPGKIFNDKSLLTITVVLKNYLRSDTNTKNVYKFKLLGSWFNEWFNRYYIRISNKLNDSHGSFILVSSEKVFG